MNSSNDLEFVFAVDFDPKDSPWRTDVVHTDSRFLVLAAGGISLSSPGLASAVVVDSLRGLGGEGNIDDPLARLKRGVENVVKTLQTLVEADSAWRTTVASVTAALCAGNQLAVAHIGNSRAYIVRNGKKHQITHDHTLGQLLIDEGLASTDEVAQNPNRSALTRWLDGHRRADFDFSLHELQPGDRLFMCTRGFLRAVPMELVDMPLAASNPPGHAAQALVALKRERDDSGHATCIVADAVPLVR